MDASMKQDGAVTSARVGFRRDVRSGASVVGTFVKLPTSASIDLATRAGFDFVVVDLEHSQLSFAESSALLSHAVASDVPAVVRIAAVDAALVNRLLEAGAAGIQLSFVRKAADVESLVAATRYPPQGRRSVSTSHPSSHYGGESLVDYLAAEADDPPLVIGQIETAATDDELETITSAGLDVVFVGTTDLSVDLGTPGTFESTPMRSRLDAIASAARATNVRFGGFAGSAFAADALVQLGASYVVVGSDTQALREGLNDLLSAAEDARRPDAVDRSSRR
jgi:4-hydroxy-2-oxoheptanedioate aldolase